MEYGDFLKRFDALLGRNIANLCSVEEQTICLFDRTKLDWRDWIMAYSVNLPLYHISSDRLVIVMTIRQDLVANE